MAEAKEHPVTKLRVNLWLATHAGIPRLKLLALASLYMLLDR